MNNEAMNNMIRCQLMPNQVVSPVLLQAISEVPREFFVSPLYAGVAYMDDDVEIIPGRYLAEPVAFAKLLQLADIKAGEKVLEVGSASGYCAAVMARLGAILTVLEADEMLADTARNNLHRLAAENFSVHYGEHREGYAENAPYDVIFICGLVEELGELLPRQLAMNGRLVFVKEVEGVKRACLMRRTERGLALTDVFESNITHVPGFEGKRVFEF